MGRITAALSPMLCDPSSWREISAAPMTPSTLPSSCYIGSSSGSFARKRKTSGVPSWSPPSAPTIPSATGLKKPTPVRRRLHKPSTGSSLSVQQAVHYLVVQDPHEGPAQPPSCGPVISCGPRRRSSHKAGSSTAQGPDGFTVLHLRHLGEHDLAFLSEIFNLSVAGVFIPAIWKNSVMTHILDFDGREVTRQGSLLSPHPTALLGNEDILVVSVCHTSLRHWVHAPPSTASNQGMPPPRPAPHFC